MTEDKPLTFSGNSYVRWRLTVPLERRLSLSLELRTVQDKARLMHAVGRVDYSILEVRCQSLILFLATPERLCTCSCDITQRAKRPMFHFQIIDGMIQFRFECGSGPGKVRVDRVLINDGYWHTVVVERINKSVKLVVDGYVVEGSGPGSNDILNLDGNDVFFGAEVEMLAHGFEEIRNGFNGCMQHIKFDLIELPLSGSSSVGSLQHYQDIQFHCADIYFPGGLSTYV